MVKIKTATIAVAVFIKICFGKMQHPDKHSV